jgi:two-component system sensor histidine kinase KdpD
LNALREIALRQTAEEVDEDLLEYMKEHGIRDNWQTVEKVLVCISPSQSSKKLIRTGARFARRFKCNWIVVNIECTHTFAPQITLEHKAFLEKHFKLAQQLGAETITLKGESVSGELARFSAKKNITQIIIGHSARTKLETLLRGSTVSKLLKKTKNIAVYVVPND